MTFDPDKRNEIVQKFLLKKMLKKKKEKKNCINVAERKRNETFFDL